MMTDVLSSTSPLAVIVGTMSLRTCDVDICGVVISICLVLDPLSIRFDWVAQSSKLEMLSFIQLYTVSVNSCGRQCS
jgi:hypothetical protein